MAYCVKLLYSPTQSGPSAIVIQLQDAAGTNVSAAGVPVMAVGIVDASGTMVQSLSSAFSFAAAGPGGTVGGAYSYKLSTKGLVRGAPYTLLFTAGNDPTVHQAPFTG